MGHSLKATQVNLIPEVGTSFETSWN